MKTMTTTFIAILMVMTGFFTTACADSTSSTMTNVPQEESFLQKAKTAALGNSIPESMEKLMIAAVIKRVNQCGICRFHKKTGDFTNVYPPESMETALGYKVVIYRVSLDSETYFYANGKYAKKGMTYPGRTHATFAVLWDKDTPHLVFKNVFESYLLQDLNYVPDAHDQLAVILPKGYTLPDANTLAANYTQMKPYMSLLKQ